MFGSAKTKLVLSNFLESVFSFKFSTSNCPPEKVVASENLNLLRRFFTEIPGKKYTCEPLGKVFGKNVIDCEKPTGFHG
jgi:hypothetical protein